MAVNINAKICNESPVLYVKNGKMKKWLSLIKGNAKIGLKSPIIELLWVPWLSSQNQAHFLGPAHVFSMVISRWKSCPRSSFAGKSAISRQLSHSLFSSPLSSSHHSSPEQHRGVVPLNRLSLTYFPTLLLTRELTQSIRGKVVFYSVPFKMNRGFMEMVQEQNPVTVPGPEANAIQDILKLIFSHAC